MLPESSGERERGKPDAQTISLGELADSISDHGQQEPIVLFENDGVTYLLDGRNRRAACIKAKVDTVLVEDFFGTEEDAEQYVLNLNIDRRDLTPGQRAEAAAKYWDMEAERAKARMLAGKADPQPSLAGGQTRDLLARRFRVSHSYIDKLHKEHEAIAKSFEKAQELQRVAEELEAKKAEAEAKFEEAKAIGDTEAVKEAAVVINQAANKKVEVLEQADGEAQKAAEKQRKIDRIRKGESVNSVFGEQKKESTSDEPISKARSQINTAVGNLKKAISDLAVLTDKGAEDYNFIGTKLEGLIEHFEGEFTEE
jgi:ParB-like chromosome segregation protein Spo0J